MNCKSRHGLGSQTPACMRPESRANIVLVLGLAAGWISKGTCTRRRCESRIFAGLNHRSWSCRHPWILSREFVIPCANPCESLSFGNRGHGTIAPVGGDDMIKIEVGLGWRWGWRWARLHVRGTSPIAPVAPLATGRQVVQRIQPDAWGVRSQETVRSCRVVNYSIAVLWRCGGAEVRGHMCPNPKGGRRRGCGT